MVGGAKYALISHDNNSQLYLYKASCSHSSQLMFSVVLKYLKYKDYNSMVLHDVYFTYLLLQYKTIESVTNL